MEQSKNFRKNFIWNVLGTGLNAFNSLFFLIIVTRINGTDIAGIFSIAFSTACVVYIIGTYAGRVYQVTENDKSINDKDYIANRLITFGLMILSTILFVLLRKYDLFKSTVFLLLAIYKGLEAFSDVLYGIMQKKDMLYKVGQSYFIKSLLSIIIFFIIDFMTKNLIFSCISIVAIWLANIFIIDIPIIKKLTNKEEKSSIEGIKKIFKNGFFVFAITFLGLYILNAPKYAIDSFLPNEYQTIFGIIVMPATVITLFGQFLLHPYLNTFTKMYEEKKFNEMQKLEKKIVFYIIGFGVIASLLAYTVGIPVLQFVYGIDLSKYKVMLTMIIIASTFYNIGLIYSNVLTTMRKTFIQFIIYIIITIFAFVISRILTKIYEIQGAVIAYFLTMFVLFIIYAVTEKVVYKKLSKN